MSFHVPKYARQPGLLNTISVNETAISGTEISSHLDYLTRNTLQRIRFKNKYLLHFGANSRKMWKKFFDVEEKQPYGVVTAYRERGHYLQRLELFQKAINAYDDSLKWNDQDIRGLLGRSLARAKATQYSGALADVAKAIEIEPDNIRAQEIQAQTEYMKCRFERALVLAHVGKQKRRCPPHFAETASQAEETIRECTGKSARKILASAVPQALSELKRHSIDSQVPVVQTHVSRMKPPGFEKTQDVSRAGKQRYHMISRLMASYYLERMAHDKYFLTRLCKDERLKSANTEGSKQLQELLNKALAALEMQQMVLRTRRPLYATRAAGSEARKRLGRARRERLQQAREQHTSDAERLIKAAQIVLEGRDTAKCLENAEFALERISNKPPNLLPKKEMFLLQVYDIVAKAFLDQKSVRETMSEADREKRAFILLGLALSREPSQDSMLRVAPLAPPRDVKQRLQKLERAMKLSSARPAERCYILHELSRHYLDTKQIQRARFYAIKCQGEARSANENIWLLNASFLLAKSHIMQNSRPEARAILLECKTLSKAFGFPNVSWFFDTCADVSTEGELASEKALLEKREQDMVNLMQDDDMKSAAKHLFRRMSALPAARRFSVMPGAKTDETTGPPPSIGRRASIMPRAQEPTRVLHKSKLPLGFQEFDI